MSTENPAEKPPAEDKKANLIDTADKFTKWVSSFSSDANHRLSDTIVGMSGLSNVLNGTKEGWWLKREVARMMYDFGQVYHPLPGTVLEMLHSYGATPAPYHFVHLSTSDPTKVAYTETWEAGLADRQQQISLGKYIKKYHPQVPEYAVKQCQEFLNDLLVKVEVKFTKNFNVIMAAYAQAAPACMSKGVNSYRTNGLHPLQVYADHPLLSMAYLEPTKGRYTARCLVVEEGEKKIYVRVYGDTILTAQLSKMGYTRGSLKGIKLPRIDFESEGRTYALCPYLDDHASGRQGTGQDQTVVVKDDHLIVADSNTKGAIPVGAEGRIQVPEWAPADHGNLIHLSAEIQPNSTTGALEWNLPGTTDGLVLGVLTVSQNTYGDRVAAARYLQFRTLDDVRRLTRPLIGGGRFMATQSCADAWKIRAVRTTDDIQFVSERVGCNGKYTTLASSYYPRVADGALRLHQAYMKELTTTDLGANSILKSDAVMLTAGEYAGSFCFSTDVVSDHLNPEHKYFRGETRLINLSNGKTGHVPKKHVFAHPVLEDMLFDDRTVTKVDGVIAGPGYYDMLGLEFDFTDASFIPTRHYDHFVIVDRERDVGIYLEFDALFQNNPVFLATLAQYLVLEKTTGENFIVRFSLKRTKDDIALLHQQLALGEQHWIDHVEFRDHSSGERYFAPALRVALMHSIVNDLDLPDDGADTLIPQPETAAEQPAHVEPTECES